MSDRTKTPDFPDRDDLSFNECLTALVMNAMTLGRIEAVEDFTHYETPPYDYGGRITELKDEILERWDELRMDQE